MRRITACGGGRGHSHPHPESTSKKICGLMRQKKLKFDVKLLSSIKPCYSAIKIPSSMKVDVEQIPFRNLTFRSKLKGIHFFCDWEFKLFGIDEDEIPKTYEDVEEEEIYEVDLEQLREEYLNQNPSDLEIFRKLNKGLTEDELKEFWIENNISKFARRARAKPILERDDHTKFECICDIDRYYVRHYIPRFTDGVKKGEELKIPHFKAYWEMQREKAQLGDMEQWSAIIEKPPQEVEEHPDPPFRSYFNKNYAIKDVTKTRKKLLASFRPLSCREVRRYRMPFAEALYLELQEDNFKESALFFKYLLIKDYFMQETPESPNIRQSKERLLKLVAFLKLAENYSRVGEYHKEATVLLKTAKYYNDHVEIWWWLAEEFYARAVKISEKCKIDGGKIEATSRFLLGKYLLDCAQKPKIAEEHLSKAIELCKGKEWNAQIFLNEKQQSLYHDCVNYLCRVLILLSEELRKKGKPEEALPLIHRSYKLCQESKRDIEMETYFELGMTYEEVGFLGFAKQAFRKFMEIAEEKNYTRRVCDGYLEMAICHRRENDMEKCLQNLRGFLHKAESQKDENLIAFGHRYLGEFYLQNENPAAAVEYFEKAFNSFLEQSEKAKKKPIQEWKPEHVRLVSDIRLCRALQGIAQGVLLAKPIFKVILSSALKDRQKRMMQLIRWKNRGEVTFELKEEGEEEVDKESESEPRTPDFQEFLDLTTGFVSNSIDDYAEDSSRNVRFKE